MKLMVFIFVALFSLPSFAAPNACALVVQKEIVSGKDAYFHISCDGLKKAHVKIPPLSTIERRDEVKEILRKSLEIHLMFMDHRVCQEVENDLIWVVNCWTESN